MFFTSKLISALKKDHDVLREYFMVLKDQDAEMTQVREAFSKLVPELRAHSKSEENVVYAYMLTQSDLRPMALEGEEEHQIADDLMNELNSEFFNGSEETWRANAKVLAELIEHHVHEEESQVFPALKKHLTADLDEQMVQNYQAANTQYRSFPPLPKTSETTIIDQYV